MGPSKVQSLGRVLECRADRGAGLIVIFHHITVQTLHSICITMIQQTVLIIM